MLLKTKCFSMFCFVLVVFDDGKCMREDLSGCYRKGFISLFCFNIIRKERNREKERKMLVVFHYAFVFVESTTAINTQQKTHSHKSD